MLDIRVAVSVCFHAIIFFISPSAEYPQRLGGSSSIGDGDVFGTTS
jgi:hypothetical protein